MKIGVGYTTYNRPKQMNNAYKKFKEHTFNVTSVKENGGTTVTQTPKDGNEYLFYAAEDTDNDRKGIAYRKNECLRALKDCDYIFLFDDDCFVIKDGWAKFFIDSGEDHLLFLSDKLHKPKGDGKYNDCGGVFMFMSKEMVEKVGAFDEKFGMYGFEHADYSNRILGEKNNYPMLYGTEGYVFAHDYSTEGHKSSITGLEKKNFVKENWDKYFTDEIKDVYLPL